MKTEKAIKDIQFIKAGYENLMANDPERVMAVGEGINCDAEVKTKGDLYAHFVESLTMAEAALEELALYNQAKLCLVPADIYKKQCEELDELKEKNTAKKPRFVVRMNGIIKMYLCPCCTTDEEYTSVYPKQRHCEKCGQKLDWSEEK